MSQQNTSFVTGRDRDCAGCRLVGGSGMIGGGLYVAYHSRDFQKKIGKTIMLGLAGTLIGLGISRIFNLPPFQNQFARN